ncbi:MAG: ribonuclease P protein subunit [Candidatus Iainarchaeum archaeon]|uniref:Ribonuclease P protein component 1 n=1 Tax=Candidatus Iainarchaeum sp. TaxID=3101447 RepID=A0A497JIF0_9ARCH|nr:MAG: ribonuclease P protein subunit [Candidatus Diapherotrites archaeon]
MHNYNITKENLPVHEWIGLEAHVVNSTDPNKICIKGRVVDETKNTVKLLSNNKIKILPKKEIFLEFSLKSGKVVLDCSRLCYAPEKRVKLGWRYWK